MSYSSTWTAEQKHSTHYRLNKRFSSKFFDVYLDQQTPKNSWRAQKPKHYDDNNKDEDINNVNNVNANYW